MARVKKGFSDFEKAAIKERARELLDSKGDGEVALLAKIEEMIEPDRSLAQKVHEIVTQIAPTLISKTWYGMPAYATADGKVIVFFQCAHKFKARYSTLGFSDLAHLDDGTMWPTSYALTAITPATEKTIVQLVRRAIG